MFFQTQPLILSDFKRFIDYLTQAKRLELTKEKGYLRTADLLQLNALMHFRQEHINPKAQQVAFSLLNTFFHIGRSAQLYMARREGNSKPLLLTTNPERIQKYQEMNYDEQYFFLLETFWCYVNWDEAYDCRAFTDGYFYQALFNYPAGKAVTVKEDQLKRAGVLRPPIYVFTVELFSIFGFLDLVWDKMLASRPSKYIFPYQALVLTELGERILPILFKARTQIYWGNQDPFLTPAIQERLKQFYEEQEEEKSDHDFLRMGPFYDPSASDEEQGSFENSNEMSFVTAFEPHLPNLKVEQHLFPIAIPSIPGAYTFRIALNATCYREIRIDGENTMQDFHEVIQKLFDFDDDHLYAFYLNGGNTYGSGQVYADPRGQVMDNEKPAHLFSISELGLYPGMEILYIFDFGDNWQFMITVLEIETKLKISSGYNVLKKVGESPEQYPEW
jgi:hypothetical protein